MRTLILALVLAASLTGCAAFQNPDGSPNKQKQAAAVEAAGTTAVTFGSFFGPVGAAVGLGLSGILGAYAAKLRGESKGYDQGSKDAGKPLASAEAPKP